MALTASRLAVERPDEVALRDDRVALGWAEVDEALNRVANGAHAIDLGPHRRYAVFAENSAETVLAHLGGLLAGASTVPANFHLNADELAYILSDSGAAALFVGPETVTTGLAAAEQAGVPLVIGWRCPELPGLTPWDQWLAQAGTDEPPVDLPPRPNLMYTSGTTGPPKGVELPPTMFAGGSSIAEHVEALAKNAFAAYGTHLVIGPMYHTGPLSGVRLLAVGIPVVVLGRFDAEGVLRRHRDVPRRDERDGAHPLRAPAGPARRGAGPVRRQLGQVGRPHRRRLPGRREAADDRVVGSGLLRRLRRHGGRDDLHDHQRGVARAPGLGRPGHPALLGPRRRRRRQRGAGRHRGPALLRGRHRAGRRLPERPAEDGRRPPRARASSRWARSATSTTTATSTSPTASAT